MDNKRKNSIPPDEAIIHVVVVAVIFVVIFFVAENVIKDIPEMLITDKVRYGLLAGLASALIRFKLFK